MEEWRPVPRFRRIEVSNLGNVRTVWDHKVKLLKPMIMKTTVGSYLKVSVTPTDTGIQRSIGIHNLVAEAFIDKPHNKMEVSVEPNHKDGDKHNNHKDNLEWMTRSENIKHTYDTGLRKSVIGRGHPSDMDKSKVVIVTNLDTGEITKCSSAKKASDITGVPARTVQYNAFNRAKVAPVQGFTFCKDE